MSITPEKIEEWKSQYTYVYKASIDNIDYYFKTLSRTDYIALQTLIATSEDDNFDYELETVKRCILNEDITEETLKSKSGIVTIISEHIMLRSGFQQIEIEEL